MAGSEKNKSQWWEFFGSRIDERLAQEKCWNWKRAKDQDGYGHTFFKGVQWRANRLSYFLWHGEIQQGKHVLHKCDNPACVNPSHLFDGTAGDNVRDCVSKGRARNLEGSKIVGSKLNERQVVEIRSLYLKRSKDRNMPALGRKYGVKMTTIHAIIKNRSWKHVKPLESEPSKWAYNHDFCIECKTSEHPHRGCGLCVVCYEPALNQFKRLKQIFK